MLVNNTPVNSAEMGNVTQLGTFSINTSAQAFRILSAGLYSNSLRAIIRELSTNAYDSHVAAGKSDIPFDVHLPITLEPYFSVRDYGVGLSHQQVTEIYTTYFASTKTTSNDFVGCLGLGSKSPFAYTENFTVIAIKDGRKGIYSAYIDDNSVPNIALMSENETDEPAGVEVTFAVIDTMDFRKFRNEAESVYKHFKVLPNINDDNFMVDELRYSRKDIIPNVHVRGGNSVAVMGNIEYPIQIPNSDSVLSEVKYLLNNGLEIHFDIGEIEIQPSREGLNYTQKTLLALHEKLSQVKAVLYDTLSKEISAIDNVWRQAEAIRTYDRESLWKDVISKYLEDHPNVLLSIPSVYNNVEIDVHECAKKYNIDIRVFFKKYNWVNFRRESPAHQGEGKLTHFIRPDETNLCVAINDVKSAAISRMNNHMIKGNKRYFILLSPISKTTEMDVEGFLKSIHNPPNSMVFKVSDTAPMPPRKIVARESASVVYHDGDTWQQWGKLSDSVDSRIYYYIPLSGYELIGDIYTSIKTLQNDLCSNSGTSSIRVYGIRKKDIEIVKTMKNWVPIEQHLKSELSNVSPRVIANAYIHDQYKNLEHTNSLVPFSPTDSPFTLAVRNMYDNSNFKINDPSAFKRLITKFTTNNAIMEQSNEMLAEYYEIIEKYPLAFSMTWSFNNKSAMVSYIEMIDELEELRKTTCVDVQIAVN